MIIQAQILIPTTQKYTGDSGTLIPTTQNYTGDDLINISTADITPTSRCKGSGMLIQSRNYNTETLHSPDVETPRQ